MGEFKVSVGHPRESGAEKGHSVVGSQEQINGIEPLRMEKQLSTPLAPAGRMPFISKTLQQRSNPSQAPSMKS